MAKILIVAPLLLALSAARAQSQPDLSASFRTASERARAAIAAHPPAAPPGGLAMDGGLLTAEGREARCRGARDRDVEAYRFDLWQARIDAGLGAGKETLTVGFYPRFLVCRPSLAAAGGYEWTENIPMRARSSLVAAVYYRMGVIGKTPLTRIDKMIALDFPSADRRSEISFGVERLLNDKERRVLEKSGEIEKEFSFYPWRRSDVDSQFTGVPRDVLRDGSWYELTLTLKSDASRRLTLSKATVVLAR